MAANIEIKARVRDFDELKGRAEGLSETPGTLIPQEDTFFHTPRGRLKLRVLAPDHGQLVYYERQDATGPRRSDYFIHSTSNPAVLKEVLTIALGVRGVVRKQRLLYWVGSTRVHLDQVEAQVRDERPEARRCGIGEEVDRVAALGERDSELGRDHPAAPHGRVAEDRDLE